MSMGVALTFQAPHTVGLTEYPEPPLAPGQVRLRTLYSGVSAGTELTQYRGSNPYLAKAWDPEWRLFQPGSTTVQYPLVAVGYEEVGQVVEVGPEVTQVGVGDVVWGRWGHKSSHVVDEGWAVARRMDPKVDPICGALATMGSIALNAVHDAEIHLGETVAVFGLGVLGLLVTQLATLNGGTVIAVDRIPRRLELARKLGAAHLVDFREEESALAIKRLTGGRGADVAIEVAGSYQALHDAIRSVAYNSRVVAAGFYQGGGGALFLGEEFHHNRVQVVCSQISGVNPRLDHRWDRLRMEQTVMSLQAQGRLDLKALVSHVVPVDQAGEAFRMLDQDPSQALQVVLTF